MDHDGSPKEMLEHRQAFIKWGAVIQVVILVLFGVMTKYADGATTKSTGETDDGGSTAYVNEVDHYYPFYQDVHVMIFVGFGFLMTFLKKYGFSSVAFNFVIAALTIQWAMIAVNFIHKWYENHASEKIALDVTSLITADFACGATLITFGAVLGKVSPVQMLVVVILEVIIYAANEVLGASHFEAVDMGGSIFVHTFGAYFGLALSRTISKSKVNDRGEVVDHPDNGSNRTSDMFAMIGTLFLWMYWPSFNGALALQSQQHRVVINTVISLCGSCISCFICDAYLRPGHKFDMVSIQNATLAGGVAVGSSSDLVIQPWGALLIGICAGCASVVGYIHIQPWLARTIRLDDTCGVHNLHGIPGIIGGIGGAISAATASSDAYGSDIGFVFPARAPEDPTDDQISAGLVAGDARSASDQAWYQMAALVCTLVISISGGILTGYVINMPCFLPPGKTTGFGQSMDEAYFYNDHHYWEVCDEDDEHKKSIKRETEMVAVAKNAQV